MQLVYIVGTGSTWHDNELRYSLRSAEQYCAHTHVLVVGHKPQWLRGVHHHQLMDPYPSGVQNVIHKLSAALHAGLLHERFMLMNDDMLFLRQVPVPPHTYTRGTLADRVARMDANNSYRTLHVRCLATLRSMGIPQPLDYGTHTPMPMRASKLLEVLQRFGGTGSAYPLRTCYGNLHRVPATHIADVKLHHTWTPPGNAPMVSTDDAVVHEPAFQAWVDRRFPKASCYE
jgi:hypothetical protein